MVMINQEAIINILFILNPTVTPRAQKDCGGINHLYVHTGPRCVFGSVVAGAFQITFHAEMHVNDVFLFFKNHF